MKEVLQDNLYKPKLSKVLIEAKRISLPPSPSLSLSLSLSLILNFCSELASYYPTKVKAHEFVNCVNSCSSALVRRRKEGIQF